jgi:hypothetical protein
MNNQSGIAATQFSDVWSNVINALILLSPSFLCSGIIALVISFLFRTKFDYRFVQNSIFFFGFALFGATIGAFIGASRQPIVGSILPPLVTLISGYVLITKESSFSNRTRVVIPGAVIVFIAMLLLIAFSMRGYVNTFPTESEANQSQNDSLDSNVSTNQ